MQAVYILSAVRTPIGKFGGSLASLTAADIGVVAAKAAMERAGIQAEQVEETIFGNARQAGGGPNRGAADFHSQRRAPGSAGVYREQSLRLGDEVDCAGLSGHSARRCQLHSGGRHGIDVAGSLLSEARWGYRLGNQELVDGMYRDGFFCPMAKMVMGETAEVLAEHYKISREEQDEYALMSQTRAGRAIAAGRFDAELVPVTIEGKKGTATFSVMNIHSRMRAWRSWASWLRCFRKPGLSRRAILRDH